ncbi:MAG: TIGR02147 family protein [Pseudobdellovibrionaceae bacterium]
MTSQRAKFDQDALKRFAEVQSYRVFIKTILEFRSENGRRFGYSDLARLGGLSARSFPRDVTLGKKNLTLASIPKFVLGMGLTGDLADYFRLLVELEHRDCRARKSGEAQLNKLIYNLRKRILDRASPSASKEIISKNLFQSQYVPLVYAALGNATIGSTCSEIEKKTSLNKEVVISTLSKLLEFGVVDKKQSRYFANENHLNFPGLSQNEIFRNFYIHLLEKAQHKAKTDFASDSNLHFCSSFSVQEKELPKFKDELRSLLLRYVDSAEDSNGNKVVSLACSLF